MTKEVTVSAADSKKAYDKVIKARTVLLVGQPFFGCLALHLNLIEITEGSALHGRCKTMAVDGINMYYWPPFIIEISEPELIGVVAHETMHCAFKHMTRRQHRNPVIWNFAGDYVINSDLLTAGFTLPEKRLHDTKYDKMSTEEVYERIKEEVEKQLKAQKQKGQGGKGGKKGQGGGGGGDEEGDGDDENTIYLPDTDLDPSCCGSVIDAAGAGDKNTADNVDREWDATVRMAVNVAKRANAGTMPGYLERLVKQLHEPRVSWRELTRQFIDQSMSKDYSWSRPNRRHIAEGLVMPGFISDALHHLVFVVDTSGSIDGPMLEAMVSEMAGALNDGTADKLTVIYADAKVAGHDEYMPGDIIDCKHMAGGGGTDFADSFRWIKQNAGDAACIIYLTDMLTGSFGEDLGIPTMWAAFLPEAQLASIKPPFGNIIKVDTSE